MEGLTYLQGDQEEHLKGLNMPSERSSLAREGIFLELVKGVSVFVYRYIFENGLSVVIKHELLQSP
jgi:hypothetical protein